MKYVFDFDDVLFNTTKMLKEQMYLSLEKVGIPRKIAEEYYKGLHEHEFSLRNSISELFVLEGKDKNNIEKVYENIMSGCKNFINFELIKEIRDLGKENCFIITNGENEFQKEKIY